MGYVAALFEATIGACFLAWAGQQIARRPVLGFLPLAIVALMYWEYPSSILIATAGGLRLYVEDLAATVLFIAGVIRFKILSMQLKPYRATLGPFALFLLLSLTRGVADLGPGTPVNEARTTIYIVCALFWAASVDWKERTSFNELYIASVLISIALTFVAAYHVAIYGFGDADSFVVDDDLTQTGRPLVSFQALFIACTSILTLRRALHYRSILAASLTLVFLSTVILVQHRTVWIAVAIGLTVLVIFEQARIRARAALVALSILWIAAITELSGAFNSVKQIIEYSASDSSTYTARTETWYSLITQNVNSGVNSILFGEPFGSGWARTDAAGTLLTFSPHNWYVLIFLRVGLLGLLLLTAFLIHAFYVLIRGREAERLAMLSTTLLFCWAYGLTWLVIPFAAYALFPPFTRSAPAQDVAAEQRSKGPISSLTLR